MPIPQAVANIQQEISKKLDDLFNYVHGHMKLGVTAGFRGVRVNGFSWNPQEQTAEELFARVRQLFAGLQAGNQEIIYCLSGSGQQVSVSLFAQKDIAAVESALRGTLDDCVTEPQGRELLDLSQCRWRHALTGMPALPQPEGKNSSWVNPAGVIARGMMGRSYRLMIRCQPMGPEDRGQILKILADLLDDAESNVQMTENNYQYSQVNRTYTISAARRYSDYLHKITAQLTEDARATGLWEVGCCFAADTQEDFKRLEALLLAAYGGENSGPDPVSSVSGQTADGEWKNTFLSGSQAAALCMFPDREVSGFYVNDPARFDQTPRRRTSGGIVLGSVNPSPYRRADMERYEFPWLDFDRHALIVGATGGGKTNTVKSILDTLHNQQQINFLVIESAKSEYWQLSALRGFENMCAYPLGSEECGFRINPFECVENFPLQTHVDSLLATFNAAFEMYPPMPFLLEQAVYHIYDAWGWDITAGKNRFGRKLWPTLSDLHDEIARTVENSSYDREIKNNVTGALQTRIRSLTIGGKGKMMDVPVSTDFTALLSSPVVMELENLGNDNTKTFVMGLLMNRLYEYRRAHMPDGRISSPFSHLLIIEEAHRLLKNVSPSEGSESRAASVEFFCNMLAEIRSYGQGIMIADQSPTKLARDAIRNTNLKIVHRIVDGDDREAVGRAMHMTEEQINALSVLKRGVAAVYAEGDHRPLLVHFPLVEAQRQPSRRRTLENALSLSAGAEKTADPCTLCPAFQAGACPDASVRRTAEKMAAALVRENGRNWICESLRMYQYSPEALFTLAEAAAALDQNQENLSTEILTKDWPEQKVFCLCREILKLALDDGRIAGRLLRRLRLLQM